jgi:hypothetical protein
VPSRSEQQVSYFESAETLTISADRARIEVENHDCDWDECTAELGSHESYFAQTILMWLGY